MLWWNVHLFSDLLAKCAVFLCVILTKYAFFSRVFGKLMFFCNELLIWVFFMISWQNWSFMVILWWNACLFFSINSFLRFYDEICDFLRCYAKIYTFFFLRFFDKIPFGKHTCLDHPFQIFKLQFFMFNRWGVTDECLFSFLSSRPGK